MIIKFETSECSRCGGAGRITAYSGIYGGICFGCNGAKSRLTRKGAAAAKRFDTAMKISVADLAEGTIIKVDGKRRKIVSITPSITVADIVNGERVYNHVDVLLTTGKTAMLRLGSTIQRGVCPETYELIRETLKGLSGATIID